MRRGFYIQSPDRLTRRWRITAVLLVVVCLAATAGAWWLLQSTNDALAQKRLKDQSEKTVNVLENNIEVYADTLYSTRALFFVDPTIDRDQWDVFVRTQDVIERYDGLQNVTYLQKAPESELQAIQDQLNQNRRVGEPVVVIRDSTPTLAVVKYVTNPDTISIVGVNANYRSVYSNALAIAERTGTVAASAVYTSRAPGREGQNDFFITVATYNTVPISTATDDERAQLATGYVTGAINVDKLVNEVLSLVVTPDTVHVRIADTDGDIFYERGDDRNDATSIVRTATMNVGGQRWAMTFEAAPDFQLTAREKAAPVLFLIGGIAFTIVVMILYLERSGVRLRFIATRPKPPTGWSGGQPQ